MRRPTNQNAILALVLALILPPLGIYFGGKARREIAVTGEEGSGLATAGVVIGWVWTGLIASITLIFCLSFAVPVLLLIFGSGIDVPNPDPSPSFPFPSPTGTPSPLPS